MRLLIAATPGGHLSEALLLLESVIPRCEDVILYTGDNTARVECDSFRTYRYRRTRKRIWFMIRGALTAFLVLRKERPDWVVSTGAQCAVFTLLPAKLLGMKTMFIETVTRVDNPTRAARIVYPFVDRFFVQHEGMLSCFGEKAEYIGGLI